MQSCCIEGCESYKFSNKQKIGYYKFPTNNKPLLQKWLSQIRIPNWFPDGHEQICSTHFHVDDIDFSEPVPRLKENAIPLIFPLKHFQSIYEEKLAAVQKEQSKIRGPKSLKKQAIACKKKMNLIDSKNALGDRQKSMILLCTPTEKLSKTPRIQINSQTQSQLKVKNIPLKSNKNLKSGLNPYILIVSENSESSIAFTKPHKPKQAVLRIQIEKKVNDVPCDFVLDNNKRNTKKPNESSVTQGSQEDNNNKDNALEEIEIDDVTSTKKVIFQFDPLTGEITVQKRDKLTNKIIDDCEKNSNAKKIISSSNENEKEIDKIMETSSQDSAKDQTEITKKISTNLENGISNEQESTIKEAQTSADKVTKGQPVSVSSINNETAEYEDETHNESQKTNINPTEELKTSIPTENIGTQKSVKKPEITLSNNESQKPTNGLAKNIQSTIELRKRPAPTELNTPAKKTTKSPAPTTESKVTTRKSVAPSSAAELKTPAKTIAKEQLTSTSTVESKTPGKTITKEQVTSTSTIESTIQVKKLTKDSQTPIRIITSKTPVSKAQTATPVVSLQRTVSKPAQSQYTSTIKKNTKTVNNKQIVKDKANGFNKKRKSDVIVINTSEDEDETLSTDNKKLKTNSNTVILHDQAVITIIE